MAEFTLEDDDVDAAPDTDEGKSKEAHKKALSKFHVSASFFSKQREREQEDLKFIDFDEQWAPQVKASRAGNQTVSGLPPTPARPAITINQLRGPCQQVAAQRRNAKLALAFAPKGSGAKQELAEAFEDIVRAIQVESRANVARNWGADRAEKAGLGWYRIDTDYCEDDPNDPASFNDQEIVYRRILNQGSVYPDPFAQEPDFSDGRCLFVTQDLPWEQYKIEFPQSKLASVDAGELTSIGNTKPDFVFDGDVDGEQGKTVRVAEYWEVIETSREYIRTEDGWQGYKDDMPEGQQTITHRRKRMDRKIMWSKINAVEYLDGPVEWNGRYIPIVPVIGEEANVNGERRWQGIVRPGREAAVAYNVLKSSQLETISLATKAPYIGYMETIEPYLEWWKHSNTRNFPMLPIKAAKGPDGSLLPPPQRTVQEPAIQAVTLALAGAKDDIHTTTGVPPVALGQLDPHERSGKAIQALQSVAETGASGYLDNLVHISMAYEGKVLRDLIPRIYDRPGRVVPAVGVDEKRRMVMLNTAFVQGDDGSPQMVPGWQKGMPLPEGALLIDLAAGEMSVQPTVGKSYDTRREEASQAIGNVLQVVPPEMAAAIAPAWLEEQDYPGARKIAEIAKKALPPQLAKAYEDEKGSKIPPEAQAQIQQLEQALQQAQQIIQTDQAKAQAKAQADMQVAQVKAQTDLQKSQMEGQLDAQKAQMLASVELQSKQAQAQMDAQQGERDNAVKLEIAKIQAQTTITAAEISAQVAEMKAQIDVLQTMLGVQHEARQAEQNRAHETAEAEAEVGRSSVMSQQEHEQARQLQREKPKPKGNL